MIWFVLTLKSWKITQPLYHKNDLAAVWKNLRINHVAGVLENIKVGGKRFRKATAEIWGGECRIDKNSGALKKMKTKDKLCNVCFD